MTGTTPPGDLGLAFKGVDDSDTDSGSTGSGPPRGRDKSVLPRWLRDVVGALGVPSVDSVGTMRRWLWCDDEVGVIVDRPTRTWQVVAFTPLRSVTLRCVAEPNERQLKAVVRLAGLDGDVGAESPADGGEAELAS